MIDGSREIKCAEGVPCKSDIKLIVVLQDLTPAVNFTSSSKYKIQALTPTRDRRSARWAGPPSLRDCAGGPQEKRQASCYQYEGPRVHYRYVPEQHGEAEGSNDSAQDERREAA